MCQEFRGIVGVALSLLCNSWGFICKDTNGGGEPLKDWGPESSGGVSLLCQVPGLGSAQLGLLNETLRLLTAWQPECLTGQLRAPVFSKSKALSSELIERF